MKNTSLIIPFFDEYKELQLLLDSIPDWSLFPNEIIVINTSNFDKNLIIENSKLVLDTRNHFKDFNSSKLHKI